MRRFVAFGVVLSIVFANVALAQKLRGGRVIELEDAPVGALHLEVIRTSNDELYVLLKNASNDAVKINTLFNENPAFGVIDFNFSERGHRYIFAIPPNEDLPTDSSYIKLTSGQIFGRTYSVAGLMHRYEVKGACVELVVTYHDQLAAKFKAFDGSIKAKPVQICIRAHDKEL